MLHGSATRWIGVPQRANAGASGETCIIAAESATPFEDSETRARAVRNWRSCTASALRLAGRPRGLQPAIRFSQ